MSQFDHVMMFLIFGILAAKAGSVRFVRTSKEGDKLEAEYRAR